MHAARVRVVVHPEGGIAAALASAAGLYQPGRRDGPGRLAPRFGGADYGHAIHQACRDGAVTGVRDRRGHVRQDRAWATGRTATVFSGITRPGRFGPAGRDKRPAGLWLRRCRRLALSLGGGV